MAKSTKTTPLMAQYQEIKARYPDAVLLFRVGDFYETFGKDAITASKILGIVLTKRNNGGTQTELAGFPHHSISSYLPKLVRSGLRVAVCDQLEDPKMVKGIVKRGVTELITPGVTFNDEVLQQGANNFLMSVHQLKGKYGWALLDVSTGEFFIAEGNENELLHAYSTYEPSELIYQRTLGLPERLKAENTFKLEDWAFQLPYANEKLTKHFNTKSLKGFGVENLEIALMAAGAIFAYLVEDTHHNLLAHITSIKEVNEGEYLKIDGFSLRNLEVINSLHPKGQSLLSIMDKTLTPMGARLLRRRLVLPLVDVKEIEKRLTLVEFFIKKDELRFLIESYLKGISDLDRLLGKLSSERISPKELGSIRESLRQISQIRKVLQDENGFTELIKPLHNHVDLLTYLDSHLQEELPVLVQKGNVIQRGISSELDTLRELQSNGKGFLQEMCDREISRTGISSLKIDFNNVFGYYIEVRNTHRDKVPEDWIRKQTLVNAERYITQELKQYEQQILGAEEKISIIEANLYREVCQRVLEDLKEIQYNSQQIAKIDVSISLGNLAIEQSYTKPSIDSSNRISLQEARHPIIEKSLSLGEKYIPNDLFLDKKSQQIIMVTGPNMSGKSAILRQTALICLMAQMGSYVPAKHAEIGFLDKIFTRVGASDNISQGESTFMVEMNEAASILNNLSERSLILLDEIGRGTSTYDGVSIAWAIAEYLHSHPSAPLTLFATHYHELNQMSEDFVRIKNYHVSTEESKGNIVFLRKLVSGGSEHSFGIHVAKLAGMPAKVVSRASQMLTKLESVRTSGTGDKLPKSEDVQLSFFQLDDPTLENIREELLKIDINSLTPIEAMMKLNAIKGMLGEK